MLNYAQIAMKEFKGFRKARERSEKEKRKKELVVKLGEVNP